MKDIVEIAKYIFDPANKFSILFVLAFASPFLIKILKEISRISHGIKGEKLDSFITSLENGSNSKEKLQVELSFSNYFGSTLSYSEITHLYKFPSPSIAIRKYLSGSRFLSFNENTGLFEFDRPYMLGLRGCLWGLKSNGTKTYAKTIHPDPMVALKV